MQDVKDLLFSTIFKDRNTAMVDDRSFNILKLNQGQTLAYKLCDKTLAVEMRQAEIYDFEIQKDSQDRHQNDLMSAHFDMAYLDI